MSDRRLPIEALILAGGDSSRMGLPKTRLAWEGIPLWLGIARKAAQVARNVRIVGAPGRDDDPLMTQKEFTVIPDPLRLGPLGGLLLGLERVKTGRALVIACDMPFLTIEAMTELLLFSPRHDVVVPRAADGLHPLCAVYSRSCVGPIRESLGRGDRQVRSFFPSVRVREFPTERSPLDWKKILYNINSPGDLIEARKLAEER